MDKALMKDVAESNRKAWNEAAGYHQAERKNRLKDGFKNPNFVTLTGERYKALVDVINEIGINDKTVAHLCCNSGDELLTLLRFGAKEGVGFDISDAVIAEARELAEISKLNAKFERVNVLGISNKYNGTFDLILITQGTLSWFENLDNFFAVVKRLLKTGGKAVIFEMHPFAYIFEDEEASFFNKGPYKVKGGLDYMGGVEYESKEGIWFMHKVSDVLKAVRNKNLTLQMFEEYNTEITNNAQAKLNKKVPLSYILVCEK